MVFERWRASFCSYSGCQKNVPMAERFFATTLMPPSFFRNINMTSGITGERANPQKADKRVTGSTFIVRAF
jgi:hypothetical protein